jgi:polyribonucleotide nucleotidyltransferase
MSVIHRNFEGFRKFSVEIAGKTFTFEYGKMAELANAALLCRCGESAILVTVTASARAREGIDYFPLSLDFEEKLYSVGKIPGSFTRREGRAGEKATLAARLIDRPMRPLFPSDMRNDVSIICTVLSSDPDVQPEILAMVGASAATAISDVPWNGPIGGVAVGLVDGKFVINPDAEQRAKSSMHLSVAGTAQKVVMIEAGADEIPEDMMFDAIMFAHEEIKKIVEFINGMVAEVGKPKFEYARADFDEELYEKIKDWGIDKIRYALDTDDKNVREERLNVIRNEIIETFGPENPNAELMMEDFLYRLEKIVVREWLLQGKRVDGRGMDEVRPLAAEVGILPRVHGSGLFTRGQTQVLTTATLGTISDQQKLDNIYGDEFKRYMHHYNFPPYSVGEARGLRGPGRREIGHGALAERALEPVIPDETEFPYSIRLVSEVLSSNGSTSQAAICGSTLALMDAGVPIKAPVAGISCGLITDGDKFTTFTDIQGVEDFYGEMDFKVGGTKKGITAIQMDLKNDGLTPEIIKEAFERCRVARIAIIDEVMLAAIPEPRKELSKYAPKMLHMTIDPEKIREVIGSGGKVIQKITADTNTKIDIEDDGQIYISSQNIEDCRSALKIIEAIVNEPEIGALFYGKVTRIMTFGAFVEIAPGKEGLVHISKLEDFRVGKVEDVLKVGDMTWVKVIEIDEKGRINLSRKDAMKEMAKKELPQM